MVASSKSPSICAFVVNKYHEVPGTGKGADRKAKSKQLKGEAGPGAEEEQLTSNILCGELCNNEPDYATLYFYVSFVLG